MSFKSIVKQINSLPLRLRLLFQDNKIPISAEVGSQTHMHHCRVGANAYIGSKCTLNSAVIGNYSCIAPGVQIGGMEHSYWFYSVHPKLSDQCVRGKITTIGHDVWIAANAIIKQGITIGDGAVIGAGSFVNKDIPPYAIAFGTPAIVYKYRFDKDTIDQLNSTKYWEKSVQEAKKILNNL